MDNITLHIAGEAEFKCNNFTMRSAKQHIMIAIAGLESSEANRLNEIFVPVLESRNKAQFIDRIWSVQADARWYGE